MKWPWRRAEERQDAVDTSYTSQRTASLLDAVIGSEIDYSLSSGVEIARGVMGRAFLNARLDPQPDGVSPGLLSQVARDLIHPGMSVWAFAGGGWHRVSDMDVMGGLEDVRYRVQIPVPDGEVTLMRDRSTVLHFVYALGAKWWDGIGPLTAGVTTGALGSLIEGALRDEMGGVHGYLLPTPLEPDTPEYDKFEKSLKAIRGRLALVKSQLAHVGVGDQSQQAYRDWVPSRLGANPPEAVLGLREAVQRSVLAMCGIPVELVERSEGASGREAWRRLLHGTLEPLGRVVAAELGRVFGMSFDLDFSRLGASDTQGQARGFRALVGTETQPGVPVGEALEISGLRPVTDA